MPIFDTCIITASGERQAEVFRALIARRVERGLYPREIDFRVYPDPPAGRVGSGGGTIWALTRLAGDARATGGLDGPQRSESSTRGESRGGCRPTCPRASFSLP